MGVIGSFDNLVTLPNVWTEVDNLLNNFDNDRKFKYIDILKSSMMLSQEKYIETRESLGNYAFFDLGVTDSLLLELSKDCKMLITADSKLSDYANAFGIKVFDIVKNRNLRL